MHMNEHKECVWLSNWDPPRLRKRLSGCILIFIEMHSFNYNVHKIVKIRRVMVRVSIRRGPSQTNHKSSVAAINSELHRAWFLGSRSEHREKKWSRGDRVFYICSCRPSKIWNQSILGALLNAHSSIGWWRSLPLPEVFSIEFWRSRHIFNKEFFSIDIGDLESWFSVDLQLIKEYEHGPRAYLNWFFKQFQNDAGSLTYKKNLYQIVRNATFDCNFMLISSYYWLSYKCNFWLWCNFFASSRIMIYLFGYAFF